LHGDPGIAALKHRLRDLPQVSSLPMVKISADPSGWGEKL
jgi:hypothetical protein